MADGAIQLLAVVPDEWRKSLTDALLPIEDVHTWDASDWQSARAILTAHPDIEVVLCASVLPDATWNEVLADISELKCAPQVLVAARYADPSLWYDVLEVGAYDLVIYPFSPEALSQAVLSASADCQFYWSGRERSPQHAGTTQEDGPDQENA